MSDCARDSSFSPILARFHYLCPNKYAAWAYFSGLLHWLFPGSACWAPQPQICAPDSRGVIALILITNFTQNFAPILLSYDPTQGMVCMGYNQCHHWFTAHESRAASIYFIISLTLQLFRTRNRRKHACKIWRRSLHLSTAKKSARLHNDESRSQSLLKNAANFPWIFEIGLMMGPVQIRLILTQCC